MRKPGHGWYEDSSQRREGSLLWKITRSAALLLIVGGGLTWGLPTVIEAIGKSTEIASKTGPGIDSPAQQAPNDDGGYELVIPAGPNGHFMLGAQVNGVDIEFMVDTGASTVVLSAADAASLDLNLDLLEFNQTFETANGKVRGAAVILREMRIEDLEFEGVNSTVIDVEMSRSLLGMSFLSRLDSYEVVGNQLILRW